MLPVNNYFCLHWSRLKGVPEHLLPTFSSFFYSSPFKFGQTTEKETNWENTHIFLISWKLQHRLSSIVEQDMLADLLCLLFTSLRLGKHKEDSWPDMWEIIGTYEYIMYRIWDRSFYVNYLFYWALNATCLSTAIVSPPSEKLNWRGDIMDLSMEPHRCIALDVQFLLDTRIGAKARGKKAKWHTMRHLLENRRAK